MYTNSEIRITTPAIELYDVEGFGQLTEVVGYEASTATWSDGKEISPDYFNWTK